MCFSGYWGLRDRAVDYHQSHFSVALDRLFVLFNVNGQWIFHLPVYLAGKPKS